VSEEERDQSRLQRVRRLRTAWRKEVPVDDQTDAPPADPNQDQLRTETLDSNDRIRDEAPEDLETRRRADQLEREVKRPPPRRDPR
jgi:hypothetical protein